MIRETSLDAYRALEDSGALQSQERMLMIFIHRLFPNCERFTRKELATKTNWTINRVTGRVFSLIEKGFLTEYPEIRDGGHLLSVAPNRTAAPAPLPEKLTGDSATPLMPSPSRAPAAAPDEQLITVYPKTGKPYQYTAVGFSPPWPADQDERHNKRREAA